MAPAKKYKVKVRVKVKRHFFQTAGVACSALAAVVLLGYSGFGVFRLASSFPAGRFFSFVLKSVSVKGPTEEISADISRRLSRHLGEAFSSGDARAFAEAVKQSYPALSRVEVDRSFLKGRVQVSAESERAVAKVRLDGGLDRYLSESGRLLGECYGPVPEDVFETDLYAVPGDALKPLGAFLTQLRAMVPDFSSRPLKLECRGAADACRLTLENRAEILWGEPVFVKSKISRLNEILIDAGGRLKGPLKVDFRYFRDGKVFVSKLPDI